MTEPLVGKKPDHVCCLSERHVVALVCKGRGKRVNVVTDHAVATYRWTTPFMPDAVRAAAWAHAKRLNEAARA